ncbi:hypothetical protein GJ654_03380 [Rhodoblastus acidophilus]|jgi:hypothetical protein|uniref:DUF8198 domain-containing protein n=1 Tax=Rhodoblastus acidophilus TaxID=1074 RepID=A0A6N8DHV8_RHOAC|nr:hypothetical protein [Rhodoblastus acidophilus]MCW2273135.1 hypothetical protein [Rhodoblastus acidophilus]MTV30032.1 hypothetical protein [Rhodoblastus acidophilus]
MENENDPKTIAVQRLESQLARATEVRTATRRTEFAQEARMRLREWQATRLARTHADLLAHPQYSAAARFFLADLYGPQDHSVDAQTVWRVLPLMKKGLPASGIETVADAIELDALSESLDAEMAALLDPEGDARAYGEAYRRTGRRDDRARQIELIRHLGHRLEDLVKAPMIGFALKAMRKPAEIAGFGPLQAFLERGYVAFRQMGDARDFVEIVAIREEAISVALFSGDDSPLTG